MNCICDVDGADLASFPPIDRRIKAGQQLRRTSRIYAVPDEYPFATDAAPLQGRPLCDRPVP